MGPVTKVVQVGTADVHTLAAVYCQLGNAYFALFAFDYALKYHQYDLVITRYGMVMDAVAS